MAQPHQRDPRPHGHKGCQVEIWIGYEQRYVQWSGVDYGDIYPLNWLTSCSSIYGFVETDDHAEITS